MSPRNIPTAMPAAPTGFTLIEVITVLAVIALILAILAPALASARRQAKRVTCLSNQRQIATAMFAYASDANDTFPIAQYLDLRARTFVAWDTITPLSDPEHARPGLIWQFADGGAVQQCPSYTGPSLTTGDPYTGYNYNTSYIGRGQGEGAFHGLGEAPAVTSQLRRPARTALVGDGGWSAGANKFMRAPLDTGVPEAIVHAGAQAYRHMTRTNVTFADGHGESTARRFRKPGADPGNEALLGWPENGFLSPDDARYARR